MSICATDPWADLPHTHRTLANALWNTGLCYGMNHAHCWAYVKRRYPKAQTLADISADEVRALCTDLMEMLEPEPGEEEHTGPGHHT